MATVYEATDLRLDRLVALKIMPPALSDDEDFNQRFVREARAAARLAHPNVVAVYDQGDDDGTLFLAMEYVAGRHTLRDMIRGQAPLPPTRCLALLEDILEGIAAAHESGIIHRDIKPENVLIDPRGTPKVADFGLARAITSATTATATGGVLMGTVSYLPPELVTHGTADARSDVYALGVLLFEMLTGTKPHTGDSPIQIAYKHVHDDVPPPSTVVASIPDYLDAFVARATARQRDMRPANAHVMLQQLRRVRQALDDGDREDAELADDLSPAITPLIWPGPEDTTGDEVFDHERTLMVEVVPPGSSSPTNHDTVALPTSELRAVQAPQRPPDPIARMPQRRSRGWIALLLVLLLAACAAAAGWYLGVDLRGPSGGVELGVSFQGMPDGVE
ncbi:MAG: serine/threonine protein kinase [Nocardioidaceae bacterium]|nr:serine/threonine protein kinase [Nocardioidaceae bacterium]